MFKVPHAVKIMYLMSDPFFLYYKPHHYFLTAVSLPIWQFCKYVI